MYDEYNSPTFPRGRVPNLCDQFWGKSMQDTLAACYFGYYSDKAVETAHRTAPDSSLRDVWRWIHERGFDYLSKLEEEEEAAAEREEKERGKVEEVWKLVDVESGKEALAVQSQM